MAKLEGVGGASSEMRIVSGTGMLRKCIKDHDEISDASLDFIILCISKGRRKRKALGISKAVISEVKTFIGNGNFRQTLNNHDVSASAISKMVDAIEFGIRMECA